MLGVSVSELYIPRRCGGASGIYQIQVFVVQLQGFAFPIQLYFIDARN